MKKNQKSQKLSTVGRAKKAIRRSIQRAFFSIDRKTLISSFHRLGLGPGDTVCVHSSLKSLGYITGGPAEVIEALIETVGPEGCILMPSFPLKGTMEGFLDAGEIYDVRKTPALTGALTEIFRNRKDVVRSLHPTNPLAAWGASAEEILKDHEKSLTPFGMETPYGRLAGIDRGYVLMMGTHIHSLLHHLQERVEFPNLFLDDERTATYIDHEGTRHEMRTKVMRPRIPYFIAIPSPRGDQPDWAILHDFALMFPSTRDLLVQKLGYRFEGQPSIDLRRKECEKTGILKSVRIGRGELGLLNAKKFIQIVEPELRGLIDRFRSHYDVEEIAARKLPYD